jgi:enoyl-CoA hydratase/carnithine racemase
MSKRYQAYTRLKLDYPSKRILRITFDRPETYNSVDAETHTQLTNIWRDINDDHDINAVIVTGAGKAFSAGGDFELIKSILDNPVARMATWKEAKDLVYNVINCNKPIISAINGVAVGAGLVVGILADVSICGKSARIVDGHTRLGVAAGDVACIIWPLLCGLAKAKYYLLTCKPLSGTEAERIGLVSPKSWPTARRAPSAGPNTRSTTGCASMARSSTPRPRLSFWALPAPRRARASPRIWRNASRCFRRNVRSESRRGVRVQRGRVRLLERDGF